MSCAEYRRLISGYLDETLSPRQRSVLLEHLPLCPPCAATLARYRQVDLLLRRLPASTPSPEVRTRMLFDAPSARPIWLPGLRMVAAAALTVLIAFGTLLAAGSWRSSGALVPALPGPAAEGGLVAARDEGSGSLTPADDARVLQQVRGSIRRPDFRPVVPAYLPKGARIDTVNLGRAQNTGPIDRLEVAYAAGNRLIRLRQVGGPAAEVERQQLEARHHWLPARHIQVAGRDWLYLQRADAEPGTEPLRVLIGQRDGMIIWLESSLPVDELARVAGSLQE